MQRGIVLLAVAAAFQPAPPRRGTPPLQAARLEEAVRRKLDEARRLDARHAGPDSDARNLAYVVLGLAALYSTGCFWNDTM